MENYNNEIFGFGNYQDENNDQISNFNYDSISGLGQSDYENDDLFSTEVENNNNSLFDNYYNQEPINVTNEVNNVGVNYVENNELVSQFSNEMYNENPFIQNFGISNNIQVEEVPTVQEEFNNTVPNNGMEDDFFDDFVNESPSVGTVEENVQKMNFDPMTGEALKPVEFVENSVEQPAFEEPQIEVLSETPVVEEQPVEAMPPIGPGLPEYLETMPFNQEFKTPDVEPTVMEQPAFEEPQIDGVLEVPVVEEQLTQTFEPETIPVAQVFDEPMQPQNEDVPVVEEQPVAPIQSEIEEEKIEISNTPIEQLNKLTEYEEDRIEETDINALFDKVSVNFKDASDIFRRNSD